MYFFKDDSETRENKMSLLLSRFSSLEDRYFKIRILYILQAFLSLYFESYFSLKARIKELEDKKVLESLYEKRRKGLATWIDNFERRLFETEVSEATIQKRYQYVTNKKLKIL